MQTKERVSIQIVEEPKRQGLIQTCNGVIKVF